MLSFVPVISGLVKLKSPTRNRSGAELTEGVSTQTVPASLNEVGTNVSKFSTAEHSVSGIELCPENRITCGRTPVAYTSKDNNGEKGSRENY